MRFSGSEIAELGIQIEINGRDFYTDVAGKSKGPKAKAVFEDLALQEERHVAVFRKILASVHSYQPAEAYPQEYFAYMNAMASEHVFTQKGKGRELAEAITTDIAAIDLGIGFEKDSILFFEAMKKLVPAADKRIMDELIAQEQDHLRRLSEVKSKLG